MTESIKLEGDGGKLLQFEFDGSSFNDEQQLLHKVISSVFLLNQFGILFYSMDLHIYLADIYSLHPHNTQGINAPFHLFIANSKPQPISIESEMVNQQEEIIEPFTAKNLCDKSLDLIETEIAQNKDTEGIPVWSFLSFRSFSMNLSEKYISDGTLPLGYGTFIHHYPIGNLDNHCMVLSPIQLFTMDFPLRIDVTNSGKTININLYLNWSYFWDDAHEGYAIIQNFKNDLLEQGWKQTIKLEDL